MLLWKDWPCIYFESHTGFEFFGDTNRKQLICNENIILGLPLLRKFKYIIFDNIKKETELSYHESFEPCV